MGNSLFGFVILHYNTVNETINCINSIRQHCQRETYKIIVVDNFSLNNTGKILKETYMNDKDVDVLLMESNVGFARGNNAGIDVARNKYNCDYVCCLNNDTLILQDEFIDLAIEECRKDKCAVIGPSIILKNNKNILLHHKLAKLDVYKNALLIAENNLKKMYSGENIDIRNEKNSLLRQFYRKFQVLFLNKKRKDVIIHGCCIIFTPLFFEKLTGFDNRTFLYREEDLLYISLKNKGLLSVYYPKIKIKHLEDSATNSIFENELDKKIFVLENQIKSLKLMINEAKKSNFK